MSLDEGRRSGPELTEPGRGSYETVRLALDDPTLVELRPVELAEVLRGFGEYLADESAALGVVEK